VDVGPAARGTADDGADRDGAHRDARDRGKVYELTAEVEAVAVAAGMSRRQRGALDASLRSLLAYLASHAPADDPERGSVDIHREDLDLFVRASARTWLDAVPPAEAAELQRTAPEGGSVDVSLDGDRLVTVVQVPVPDRRPSPSWS
jgi:hypothetical protein